MPQKKKKNGSIIFFVLQSGDFIGFFLIVGMDFRSPPAYVVTSVLPYKTSWPSNKNATIKQKMEA